MLRHAIVFAACIGATASVAQPTMSQTDMTPEQAKAHRQKQSPANVKSATAGTAKGYTGAAADASAKSAEQKNTPSVTPDNASKQEALKSATAGTAKGYTGAAADASAIAAKDKSKPAPKPKAKAGTPELNKLVP